MGRQSPEPAPRLAGRLVLWILHKLVEERLERATAGGLLVPTADSVVGHGVDGAVGVKKNFGT
jgi:hypothetical protein